MFVWSHSAILSLSLSPSFFVTVSFSPPSLPPLSHSLPPSLSFSILLFLLSPSLIYFPLFLSSPNVYIFQLLQVHKPHSPKHRGKQQDSLQIICLEKASSPTL